MITSDLVEYIKLELGKSISKDLIISNLSSAGWHIGDIEEGFSSIVPEVKENNIISNKYMGDGDIYAVSQDVSDLKQTELTEQENLEEPIKIQEEVREPEPEPKLEPEKEKVIDPYRELPVNIDTPLEKEVNNIIKEEIIQPSKIWVPSIIEPKIEEQKNQIEPYNLELQPEKEALAPIIVPPVVSVPKIEIPKVEVPIQKEEIKVPTQIEELIPTINKNPFSTPKPEIQKPEIQKIQSIKPTQQAPIQMMDVLPRNAMIASLSNDVLSMSKEKEVVSLKKKHPFLKWTAIIIALIVISITVLAFVMGTFFVKKDPNLVILNYPANFAKLKSYKVDTNVTISIPSLSSITTGLSSGNAISSGDKDSISLVTNGVVNHVNNNLAFDYLATLKSSVLENDIISNWKYDGSNLQISIPDLSQILGKDAPAPTTVSMTPDQLSLIISELSPMTQEEIKKIDIYNIIGGGIPLYVKNSVSSAIGEFINSMDYSQKGEESIHGIDTYHYELTSDRVSTKKFLTAISDTFITQLSVDQKQSLDEALGASTMNSLDVWIGKSDSNLYQIKISIALPLSKVLRINDSGIAGNEVNIDWTMTYYDLDVANDIKMSDSAISAENFVKNVNDLKIKNAIYDFSPQATLLKNAIGSYGGKSNTSGSCTEPASGSLFSPLGHSKTADNVVGAISNVMNEFLIATNKEGLCYSTTKAWAISAPLNTPYVDSSSLDSSSSISYYCADSTGKTLTLGAPITGTVCK